MNRKHVHNSHAEKAANPIDALTRADIAGFARTLDAIRDSKVIPESLKINLCEALDVICNLDEAGDTDQLSPRFVMVWLPTLLSMGEPITNEAESGDSPIFPMSDELRAALDADARRCCRSPHSQTIAILEAYFDLSDCSLKGDKERKAN